MEQLIPEENFHGNFNLFLDVLPEDCWEQVAERNIGSCWLLFDVSELGLKHGLALYKPTHFLDLTSINLSVGCSIRFCSDNQTMGTFRAILRWLFDDRWFSNAPTLGDYLRRHVIQLILIKNYLILAIMDLQFLETFCGIRPTWIVLCELCDCNLKFWVKNKFIITRLVSLNLFCLLFLDIIILNKNSYFRRNVIRNELMQL